MKIFSYELTKVTFRVADLVMGFSIVLVSMVFLIKILCEVFS
jgi:hypothetical protein